MQRVGGGFMETVPLTSNTGVKAFPAQPLTSSEPMTITSEAPLKRSSQGNGSEAMELISNVAPKSSAAESKTGAVANDNAAIDIDLIGVKMAKKPGAGPHICPLCQLPIRIYGRLTPCRHSFCWTCAQPPQCALCNEPQTTLEKIPFAEATAVFVCNFPKCGRSYTSEYSFQEHQKLRAHHDRPKNGTEDPTKSSNAIATDSKPKEELRGSSVPSSAVPGGAASTSADKLSAAEAPRKTLLNLTVRPQGVASGAGGVDTSGVTATVVRKMA